MLITKDAVLTTVLYGDIFDYPLTQQELIYWLIGSRAQTLSLQKIRAFRLTTQGNNRFITLRSKASLISIRQKRHVWSQQKWEIAHRVVRFLSVISTIELVGVTGALAMHNAKHDDDIDLFIIVSQGTLWSSRLLATLLIEILGMRRHPSQVQASNKICLNMFATNIGMAVPKSERDLFSAHEVLQMVPLLDKRNIYKKFLVSNIWVKKFLPNAWEKTVIRKPSFVIRQNRNYELRITYYVLRMLEPFARIIQLRYMERRRTSEIISDHVLRFHPRDARIWVKQKLQQRLSRYNVPLDKVFYGR